MEEFEDNSRSIPDTREGMADQEVIEQAEEAETPIELATIAGGAARWAHIKDIRTRLAPHES